MLHFLIVHPAEMDTWCSDSSWIKYTDNDHLKNSAGSGEIYFLLFQKKLNRTKAAVVADIDSGTGILTELFLKNGNPVFAIEPNKEIFQQGGAIFATKFQKKFDKKITKGDKTEMEDLFADYFDVSAEVSQKILWEQRKELDQIDSNSLDNYLLYKFLFSIRYFTLFGYFTSERVGKEITVYDAIPAVYKGCISLEEATKGKAWTL